MPGTANSGGNRQKTRQQHELGGTFRKDRHSDLRTPEPTTGRPDPPVALDSVAQEEWDRMIWAFEDMGMLHKVDAFAVSQYCKLFAETEAVSSDQSAARAGVKMLEENLADVDKSEVVQLFQEIVTLRKLVSKCTDQLRQGRMAIRQYLVEFGLTPSSRGRIKLPAAREEVDAFTQFQQRRVS